jgi:hypothetical protein
VTSVIPWTRPAAFTAAISVCVGMTMPASGSGSC